MNVYGKNIFMLIFLNSLLIGCATPLTKSLINDIGIEDIDRFQYYTSDEIRLTATERVREPNVNKSGTATVRELSFRDVIIIGKNTMGVLMDQRVDENGILILDICFEENILDSDKVITFRQDGAGLEQKFFIVYTDPRRRVLQYGDREYAVETQSGERIFLRIKVKKSEIENERIRRVKGRRVEN